MTEGCLSCATLSGSFIPPGGIVFEHSEWIVVLRAKPARFPCLPVIILKRHCEDIAELEPAESKSLGQLMTLTAQVLNQVLQPAKVHFGIYSESVSHIHVHVFPRMPNMPAGNLPNLWIGQWVNFLQSLGLKKPYADEVVAQYAKKLRPTYFEFENLQQI